MAHRNAASGAGPAPSGLFGIVLIVLGILCIAAPFVAGTFAAMMIAASVLMAGVLITIGALQTKSGGAGIFGVLIGVVTTLAGAYMLAHPLLGLASITLVLAIYFGMDGVFHVIGGLQARPAPGWGMFVFGGVVSMALGYMIYSNWPFSGAWVVGTLVGIRLLFGGMLLMTASGAQS